MKTTINNVRLAFPNIFEPKVNEQGKAQIGAAFIFAPGHPAKAQLDKIIDEVGQVVAAERLEALRERSRH